MKIIKIRISFGLLILLKYPLDITDKKMKMALELLERRRQSKKIKEKQHHRVKS